MKKISERREEFVNNKRNSPEGRRVSDRFYKIISDNLPVSIVTINKNGDITSTNKYFDNLSKKTLNSKQNIFKVEYFVSEKLDVTYKKILKSGIPFRREHCHVINSKGEDKYFNIIIAPFKNNVGKIEGAVFLAIDNTEATMYKNQLEELNNNLEDKVKQRIEEIAKVNEELSKVLALKSTFIADVSHEFRTSLAIMQSSSELISMSKEIKTENIDLFKNIITEIKRISGMLADLSLLSKSDSQDSKLNYKKININSLISPICDELQIIADKKKIKIEHINSYSVLEIKISQPNIEKLLINLIGNAIKYNNVNGWIKVWAEETYSGIYLKVKDNGIGISKAEIPHIFERFYKVDKARTRNGIDSGLGLAICKHIAEIHGGNISVTSEIGSGTTFSVYLPYIL